MSRQTTSENPAVFENDSGIRKTAPQNSCQFFTREQIEEEPFPETHCIDFAACARETFPNLEEVVESELASLNRTKRQELNQTYKTYFLYERSRDELDLYILSTLHLVKSSTYYYTSFSSIISFLMESVLFTGNLYVTQVRPLCVDFLGMLSFFLTLPSRDPDMIRFQSELESFYMAYGGILCNTAMYRSLESYVNRSEMDAKQMHVFQILCYMDGGWTKSTLNKLFSGLFEQMNDLAKANRESIRFMESTPPTLKAYREKIPEMAVLFLKNCLSDRCLMLLPFSAFTRLYLMIYSRSPMFAQITDFVLRRRPDPLPEIPNETAAEQTTEKSSAEPI